MSDKILISIAIPTYNRASYLSTLLNCIVPQAQENKGLFQICISNNNSTDNTREVIMSFNKRHPDLIKYNENEKNLGADRNLLKALEMSEGKFIWILGDDDMVVNGGLKKVAGFVKGHTDGNTGVIFLSHKQYSTDRESGKRLSIFSSQEEGRPKSYEMNLEDVMGLRSWNTFMSLVLFNGDLVKRTLREEKEFVEKAIETHYIHVFLYQLMFIDHPNIKAIKLNETIIDEQLHHYKPSVQDAFIIYYVAKKKFYDLLLSSQNVMPKHRKVLIKGKNKLRRSFIRGMGLMRAFDVFDYPSPFSCIKLFFQQADFLNGLLFLICFFIFYITPPLVLRSLYKAFIKIKYKEKWDKVWLSVIVVHEKGHENDRKFIC